MQHCYISMCKDMSYTKQVWGKFNSRLATITGHSYMYIPLKHRLHEQILFDKLHLSSTRAKYLWHMKFDLIDTVYTMWHINMTNKIKFRIFIKWNESNGILNVLIRSSLCLQQWTSSIHSASTPAFRTRKLPPLNLAKLY